MNSQVENGPQRTITVNGSERSVDLREHDVVCEKGRGDHERWPGNKLYRHLINANKESYNELTPMERSGIIGKIINSIKEKDGWFVQHDEKSGKWAELNEEKVRKKVSDDLRREVRRRREKKSNNTVFSAKLRALKEMEEKGETAKDILQPVDDPRPTDVLFGPGARRHQGNKTYWSLMKLNLDHYIISPYGARSMISRSIVQGIRKQNGRFLEQDPKTAVWYEISDKRAIEKTSHALSNKKYKTRKKTPGESSTQYPFQSSSQENDEFDEDGEYSSEKQVSSPTEDSPEAKSRAKKMSKKFRLLQRMGGPIPSDGDDEKESIASTSESTANTTETPTKKVGVTDSPPCYAMYRREGRAKYESPVAVTPHDSSVSDESRSDSEHEEPPRSYRSIHPRIPPIPEASEVRDYIYHKAEIGARFRHYDRYAEDERYGSERPPSYKTTPSTYDRFNEYQPSSFRRYTDRGIPTEYVPPRGQQPISRAPYGPIPARRLVKTRGASSSYWVNEWRSPAKHMDEYSSWH